MRLVLLVPLSRIRFPIPVLVAQHGLTAEFDTTVTCTSCTNAGLDLACNIDTVARYGSVAGDRSIIQPSFTVSGIFRDGTVRWGTCDIKLINAGYTAHEACGTTPGTRYTVCRHPDFGHAPLGECGTENVDRASDSNLARDQVHLTHPTMNPSVTPRCSTLEDTAVDSTRLATTMTRKNQSDPFWDALPATEAQEQAARQALVMQAKLMFELGISSSSVSAADLRALYTSHPDAHLSCGVAARPEVSPDCQSWSETNGLVGPIGVCQRMLSSHIAPAVFAAELATCLNLISRTELRDPGACALEHRDLVAKLSERLLSKAFAQIHKPSGTSALAGLGTALSQLDRWYAAMAQAFAQSPDTLADATGRMLLAFWDRVYEVGAAAPASFPPGSGGSTSAGQMLDQLSFARLEAHRQILAAAFAAPAPLDDVPLLLLTADAMETLHERLRTSAPLYDFACRITGTCSASNANEATRLLRLIGAIGNAAALNSAIDAAAVRAEWLDVFRALRDRRAALEAAYRSATGRTDASLNELYQPEISGPAAGLAELVSQSWAMWTSYEAQGTLLPRDGTALRASLSSSTRDSIVLAFNGHVGQLRLAREDYQGKRGDFANTILARINQRQHVDRLLAEIEQIEQEYDDIDEDLDGLTRSQDHANLASGQFMATYIERASQNLIPNYPISTTPRTIQISAANALGHGTVSDVSEIPDVALRDPLSPEDPISIDVGKGDMLTFEVTGQWAPTCALRNTTLAAPHGLVHFADPTNALTGSEGYSIVWENGQFRAKERSTTVSSSTGTEKSICGSISAGLGRVPSGSSSDSPISAIGSATLSGSYCKKWQTGLTFSDSTSSGQRINAGASFAGGMRIPGTPFPSMPGGSLLAVQVEGAPGHELVTDVQVVRPRSTLLFNKAGKVYLVVNDKGRCNGLNHSALSVTFVHAESQVEASEKLAQTMANVLTSLSTEKQRYIAQGSVTAAELSFLQAAAYDQLRNSCNRCDLSAFPEAVRGMFDAWLGSELAAIERQTRITATTRALDRILLRLEALHHDVSGTEDSSRLLALMTSWQLGHLAFHQLGSKVRTALGYGNDYILPMLRVRYPQALLALRINEPAEKISDLRNSSWTLPFDEQSVLLQAAMEAVSSPCARVVVA